MKYVLTYFTKLQVAFAIAVITVIVLGISFSQSVYAATGINRTINFQGKLVDNAGLNVADSTYSVVFALYDRSSSGTTMWSETQSVTTVDGIFRVALGSSTPIPANFNFNWDGIYLGIKVGADAEMTPRIRMASVPFAFNSEKVAGLTVQDESGNASTSGTLKIPNGKTISFGGAFTTTAGNDLTITTSGTTSLVAPTTGTVNLLDTTTSQTLTNKIIGSTGLTFTGATTDITTGTNEDFSLVPNGTGLIGLGTTSPASFLHVYGGNQGGNALAIFDQRGASANDIFAASASGLPKFVIGNSGNVGIGTTLTSSFNLDVTGTARFTGAITVASCSGCGASSQWTTAGNNLYYTTGGVGIGTTSPVTDLHVYGKVGGSAALLIDQRGTNTPDILTGSASGVTKFVFNNSGNLGIGSSIPSRRLAIVIPDASTPIMNISNQTGEVLDITGAGAVTFGNSGNNNSGGMYNFGVGGSSSYITSSTGDYVSINAGSSNVGRLLNVLQNSTSRFAIQANGNVGIGTTTINSLLDVRGSTITSNSLMSLVQNGTADIFTASAGATSRFTIRNDGNVGIGTSLPSVKLSVVGDILGSNIIQANNYFQSGNYVFGATGFNTFTNTDMALASNGSGRFTFSPGGVEKMRIENNGNVGIGTSTVSSLLHLRGTTTGNALFTADQLTITGDIFTASSSGLSKFTIQNNGNIGIGTTLPASTLYINGTTTGNAALTVVQNTGTGDLFTASAAATTKFVIDRSGNVGIGQSVPSAYNLDVTGTARFTGAITVGSCSGCGAASQWTTSGSSIYYNPTAGGVGIGTTTDPTSLLHLNDTRGGNASLIVDQRNAAADIFTASSSGTPRFVIQGGGTIVAGTDVAGAISGGNVYSSTIAHFAGNVNSYAQVNVQNRNSGTSASSDFIATANDGTDTTNYIDFGINSSGYSDAAFTIVGPRDGYLYTNGGNLAVGTQTAGKNILFHTGGTLSANERMRIAANGNVGIGTTTVNSLLDIRGTTTGNSLMTLVQNTSADIFTASAGAATKFVIGNGGMLSLAGGQTSDIDTLTGTTLKIGASTATTLTLGRSGQAINLPAIASNNNSVLYTGASGVLSAATTTNTGACLISNGASSAPSWGSCSGTQLVDKFDIVNGLLYNANQSLDFAIGGTSSNSAEFVITQSGTRATASISANTSFAGLSVNQFGLGDVLTASSSGVSRFTVANTGAININSIAGGVTIDRTGSNDIVKTTSGNNTTDSDFQRTANATSAVLTNLDNSGGDMALSIGSVSGNGTITTGSQPAVPAAIGAGANSISRPDGKYLVIRGGATTTMYIYDSKAETFTASPNVLSAAAGAGSLAIPRPDGKYLVVHGNSVATTSIVDPMDNVPTVAGPTATGLNGAGTNLYRRQNGQYLLVHGGTAGTSRIYNVIANTWVAGPTAGSTTWGAGSLVLPRPDGTALIVAGGASANTQLYNPFDGAASIGSFTTGPLLPTNCEINGGGSVALQLPSGRYLILSKLGRSVEYDPATNTMGNCQNVGPAAALADGAHAIRMQDKRYIIFRGSGTTDVYIYDATTNTYSTHASSTSTQGAGAHSIQEYDGTWRVIVGGSTTTNKFDSQLVMRGSYVSEDINTTNLSPDSTIWFTAGAEARFSGTSSATLTGDLPQTGLEINVQTASSQGGLSTATSIPIRRNGDLIQASQGNTWVRVTVNFTRPLPQQLYDERGAWMGNGKTTFIRDYQDPTLYDYKIDNSTVLVRNQFDWNSSMGASDPLEASSSALTRVQAMSDRLTLPWGKVSGPTQISTNGGFYLGSIGSHPPLLTPTGDGTLVIQRPGGLISIIASGSANMSLYDPASSQFTAQSGAGNIPTTGAGSGAFALKLPSGKFLLVMGGQTATTNIYDPNAASGSQFVQGPNLSGVAGYGAQAILNKDGTYTIVHGGGLTTTTLFNPFADVKKPAGSTLSTGPTTSTAVNCGSWAIPLAGQLADTYRVFVGFAPFATGNTTSMMYDAVAKQFTAGPALTGAHGCGSYAFQRQDGYWVTVAAAGGTTGAQSTATSIINPWSNTNIAGPTLTTAVGRGSIVIPRADGTFLITRGQTQTINGNGTNIYLPWGGTFGVGAGIGTTVAGPSMIDYTGTPGILVQGAGSVTFQRPDGKWVILAGGHTGSNIVNLYDAGWYPDGQYLSGQIYATTLTTDSTISWKKTNDDFVDFQVRTAPTRDALYSASYRSVSRSGDSIGASNGDKWIQVQVNFSRRFLGYDGINQDVSLATSAFPAQVISQPTVFEYKVNNSYDFLTLKNDGVNAFRVNKYGAVYAGQQGGFYAGGADLAENYTSKDVLQKGEVVQIDSTDNKSVKRSTAQYQNTILGVVSTDPGFVAGAYTENSYPIALVGRVPVKVSTENGPIHAGDVLTSASIRGYAMKATTSGRSLGKALEDLNTTSMCPQEALGINPTTSCGVVMMFVNLTDYQGSAIDVLMKNSGYVTDVTPSSMGLNVASAHTDAGLSDPSIQFSHTAPVITQPQLNILSFLKELKAKNASTGVQSEIFTDRLSAAFEIITPTIIADTIFARRIKADSIEGLEILTNKISSLDDAVNAFKKKADATSSAVLSAQDKITATPSADILTKQNILSSTGPATVYTLTSLQVDGLASISADMRVKGNSLVEGVLTVIDSITAHNIIVTGISNFFGDVFFKGKVSFSDQVTFPKDSAGVITIEKGKKTATVTFSKEFETVPLINISVTVDRLTEDEIKEQIKNGMCSKDDSIDECQDTYEQDVLSHMSKYVISRRTTKGFTIVIDREVKEPLQFSWSAMQVINGKIPTATDSVVKGGDNP